MSQSIFTNARVVLPGEVVEGTLVVRSGRIFEVLDGQVTTAPAEDLEGDYLIPGLVELHTDHLETHYSPRAGLRRVETACSIPESISFFRLWRRGESRSAPGRHPRERRG